MIFLRRRDNYKYIIQSQKYETLHIFCIYYNRTLDKGGQKTDLNLQRSVAQ